MGFIEETGAARLWRDARIAPIYEGTNGIQAADLVTRKLPLSGGAQVRGFIAELREIAEQVRASNLDGFGETAERLSASLADLEESTDWLLARLAAGEAEAALAGATPYQRLFGLTLTGAYLAKGAMADEDHGRPERLALCRFAAENLIAETAALKDRIIRGATALRRRGRCSLKDLLWARRPLIRLPAPSPRQRGEGRGPRRLRSPSPRSRGEGGRAERRPGEGLSPRRIVLNEDNCMTDHILIERPETHPGVLVIRFNRPDKKNAITSAMYRAMVAGLHEAGQDKAIMAVAFLGTEVAFPPATTWRISSPLPCPARPNRRRRSIC